MELSNELKVERIRLSLTAKSVAEEMGISRQQLCNIEQSETAPVVVKYIAFLRSKGVIYKNNSILIRFSHLFSFHHGIKQLRLPFPSLRIGN